MANKDLLVRRLLQQQQNVADHGACWISQEHADLFCEAADRIRFLESAVAALAHIARPED